MQALGCDHCCMLTGAHIFGCTQATFEVLNVLDFTSERARMSIIVRAPDGTIRLHCKGSDSALLARLRPGMDAATLHQTHTNLHELSVKARLPCLPIACFLLPLLQQALGFARRQQGTAHSSISMSA